MKHQIFGSGLRLRVAGRSVVVKKGSRSPVFRLFRRIAGGVNRKRRLGFSVYCSVGQFEVSCGTLGSMFNIMGRGKQLCVMVPRIKAKLMLKIIAYVLQKVLIRERSRRKAANVPARTMCVSKGRSESTSGKGGYEANNSILCLAIIDILQDYDISKRLEHACKSLQVDPTSLSVVDPKL
ncbi:hypothetical protein BC332_03216 [Capsicum chinense]|nr:hypothetical protein BC332_03216 [Capsicum chinense]